MTGTLTVDQEPRMNREEIIKMIIELRDTYRGWEGYYSSTGHEVERHFSLGVSDDLTALLVEAGE